LALDLFFAFIRGEQESVVLFRDVWRLSGNPSPNPAVAFIDNTCEAAMMSGTVENRGGQRWRGTKMVRKSGFLTYVRDFLPALAVRHAQPV